MPVSARTDRFLILNPTVTALLTFSCDLDTFPHFSTSRDVNAYHIDLRSSDFRSIFRDFAVRKSSYISDAFARLLRSGGTPQTKCGAECRLKDREELQ